MMVALINKKCRVCFTEQDVTEEISKLIPNINECLPITIEENDGLGVRVCHKCLFDITLCGELITKYKTFENIPEGNQCFLCLKENISLPVHGNLFRTIRKVESSLTVKNILKRSTVVGRAPWDTIKKRLRSRKICMDCYFMVDTVANLYDRIKESDASIRKIVEETENWLYGDDPVEEEENATFRVDANRPEENEEDEVEEEEEERTIKEEALDSEEEEYSDNVSRLSENLSDIEEEINNHDLIKNIKNEKVEHEEIFSLPAEETTTDFSTEASTSTGNKKRGRKRKQTVKEEPEDYDDDNKDFIVDSIELDDAEIIEDVIPVRKRKSGRMRKVTIKEEPVGGDDSYDESLMEEPYVNNDSSLNPLDEDFNENKGSVLQNIKQEMKEEDDESQSENAAVEYDSEDPSLREKDMNREQKNGKRQNKKRANVKSAKEIALDSVNKSDEGISACSWCKITVDNITLKNDFCVICCEKYRKAMAGIHAGRTCRVFVTDIKYSSQKKFLGNGETPGILDNNITQEVIENEILESGIISSNRKRKRNLQLSINGDVALNNKKLCLSSAEQRDANSTAITLDSVGSLFNKKRKKQISKENVTKSVASASDSGDMLKEKNIPKNKERKRTISTASSSCSERDYYNKSTAEVISDEENNECSYSNKKKKNECLSDVKLKFLQGWQIKLDKINYTENLTNTNNRVPKKYKAGPKSRTKVMNSQRNVIEESVDVSLEVTESEDKTSSLSVEEEIADTNVDNNIDSLPENDGEVINGTLENVFQTEKSGMLDSKNENKSLNVYKPGPKSKTQRGNILCKTSHSTVSQKSTVESKSINNNTLGDCDVLEKEDAGIGLNEIKKGVDPLFYDEDQEIDIHDNFKTEVKEELLPVNDESQMSKIGDKEKNIVNGFEVHISSREANTSEGTGNLGRCDNIDELHINTNGISTARVDSSNDCLSENEGIVTEKLRDEDIVVANPEQVFDELVIKEEDKNVLKDSLLENAKNGDYNEGNLYEEDVITHSNVDQRDVISENEKEMQFQDNDVQDKKESGVLLGSDEKDQRNMDTSTGKQSTLSKDDESDVKNGLKIDCLTE